MPPGTFGDSAVAALVRRAIQARGKNLAGLESYQGLVRERLFVGLTVPHFRRERGLLEQERVARFRWSAKGPGLIEWIGAREAVPILGADTRRDAVAAEGEVGRAGARVQRELRSGLPDELLRDTDLPAFALDAGSDRLLFGGDWVLNPLADTALADYRYFSGDTLRLTLPSENREIVLYEVRVEPRRADFHLVAGFLWLDARTASLVRAVYRPARPYRLGLDDPRDAKDVPGLLKPVEASISYVTVDYGLYDFRYWLPQRFALRGEVRLGSFVRMPLSMAWTVRDYRVNEAARGLPSAEGPLPSGWRRRVDAVKGGTGTSRRVAVVVPPPDSLLTSPALSPDSGTVAVQALSDVDMQRFRAKLESLLPTYRRFQPRWTWGLRGGMTRYNRVEGLSTGVAATVPLDPETSVAAEVRAGTADLTPDGALSLSRGSPDSRWTVRGYRSLLSMSDWSNPFSLESSLDALVLGQDRGQYYRATGLSVAYHHRGPRVTSEMEVFHEHEGSAHLGTDFFLLRGLRPTGMDPVLRARAVTLTGFRGALRWFSGIDPAGLIVTARILGEAAVGDVTYERLAAVGSVSHPLPLGLSGALEAGGGTTWGDDLVQRHFFLGGSATLRGFDANSIEGRAFWRARAELANDFPGARLAVFADAGWAGARRSLRLDGTRVGVGLGGSFLDGLIRLDLAHAVRGGADWELLLYLDGLL